MSLAQTLTLKLFEPSLRKENMNFYCVARFPLDHDMTPLRHALEASSIAHRFVEENNNQLLWVAETADPEHIKTLIESAYRTDAERAAGAQRAQESLLPGARSAKRALTSVPVTLAFIVLGLVGYAAFKMPLLAVIEILTYTPSQIVGDRVFFGRWQWAEAWRLFAPCLLHFSLVHIAFNSAAMLQVGPRLELSLGSTQYLVVCLLIGIAGNVVQFMFAGPSLFGGLSGIVFGLFAFNGMLQRYAPAKALILPKGAYLFLTAWLVAGFTPIFEVLLGVQMGNGAHLGGAIAGLALAYGYCLRLKRSPDSRE